MKLNFINPTLHLSTRMGAACILGLCIGLSTAYAQNPSPPGELRHSVYSKRSAEVFWERATDDTVVIGYEVAVNGEIAGIFDATSYYARTYTLGEEYTVRVTSIDNEGNRSTSTSVTFTGGQKELGSSSPANPPVPEEPSTDNFPEMPENLQATVYSRRTFELFWDRVTSTVLQYEVFVDGVLVDTTAGTSSIRRDLLAGTEYDVEVVAVDLSGNRSNPAAIKVRTNGQPVVETPTLSIPPTPLNTTHVVYSRRSIEIFWDRAPVGANVVNNEIKRDGELIGETNGTSFYDNTRVQGMDHSYEIIAVNGIGVRSAPSMVSITQDTSESDGGTEPEMGNDPDNDPDQDQGSGNSVFKPSDSDITDVDSFYDQDGYDSVDVIRVDVRTVTSEGSCTIEDQSGCTLDDVKADIDGSDDFSVDIAIHVKADDLPDDGSISNATMRQRGNTSRLFPQKSFRIKLDSKEDLWRNERRFQLNKHPNERSRVRNKLSFDLMRGLPHLPSLRTQFVNLWIDDGRGPEDYGLFTHVEFVGKEYLVNRQLNEDDRVYKIEIFRFSQSDLDNLIVDEDGKILDEKRFESRLDPKRGDDHSTIVDMLTAFHNPAISFDDFFSQYFNRNNVLTWFTANVLLYQTDAISHNYYLYNPLDSENFYFLPWDYDGTFHPDSVLTNSFDNNELAKRLYYGYARGANSEFIKQFLRLPGIHQEIVATANELRNTYLTDSNISERAERYSELVEPYLTRSPDSDNNPKYSSNSTRDFAAYVSGIHQALQNDYDIPMPHTLLLPEIGTDELLFSWTPAYDVTQTNSIEYDLEVSTSVAFDADSLLLSVYGIADDPDLITYPVDVTQLRSGKLYYRVIARGDTDPENIWQVSTNTLKSDGTTHFGMLEFELP